MDEVWRRYGPPRKPFAFKYVEVCHTGGEGHPLERCKSHHGENVAGSVTEKLGVGQRTA